MTDTLTQEERSERMRRIRSKNTKPELRVRRLIHSLGYRYRLHGNSLPGRPDLVFPGRHKVIFVHGCFWHAHGCKVSNIPKSRAEYWKEKFEANKKRDERNLSEIRALGWEALVIWECEVPDESVLNEIAVKFLGPARRQKGGET